MALPQPFLSNLSSKGSTKKNGRNGLKNGCAKLVLSYSERRGCELALYNFSWIEWIQSFSVIMRCKLFTISSYSKMKYLNLWLNFLSYHFYFQELPANSVLLVYLSATGVFPTGHSDYEGMFLVFFCCCLVLGFFVCNFMEFLNTIIDRFGVEISNVITAVSTCLW